MAAITQRTASEVRFPECRRLSRELTDTQIRIPKPSEHQQRHSANAIDLPAFPETGRRLSIEMGCARH
jgi:hypothetical protein